MAPVDTKRDLAWALIWRRRAPVSAQQYGRCIPTFVLREEVPGRVAELLKRLDHQKNADSA
jgi:hypothetical protein